MKNIKIVATDSDLAFSPKRDENEEKCYERGVDTNNIFVKYRSKGQIIIYNIED